MRKGQSGVSFLYSGVLVYTNMSFCIEFNINCTETRQKSAGEKMTYVMDKLMSIRKQEVIKLQENPNLVIGDVTTVNLTMLKVRFV